MVTIKVTIKVTIMMMNAMMMMMTRVCSLAQYVSSDSGHWTVLHLSVYLSGPNQTSPLLPLSIPALRQDQEF